LTEGPRHPIVWTSSKRLCFDATPDATASPSGSAALERPEKVADYEIPETLLYTNEDEWVRREENGDEVVIGVTDFAQSQLGDIVFVELPEPGSETEAGVPFGTIESVKAVSDLFSPLSGEVIAVNDGLEDAPEQVNESCYEEGWLIRLRPSAPEELDDLLDANAYRESVEERDS
jgi:glycine cleavage system H protein